MLLTNLFKKLQVKSYFRSILISVDQGKQRGFQRAQTQFPKESSNDIHRLELEL